MANADDNNIAQDGDADQACANNDEAFDENHDSDEEGGADSSKKGIQDRTPLKARWLVPLVLREIAEKPNMSNADMRNVLSEISSLGSSHLLFCKMQGQWPGNKFLETLLITSSLPMLYLQK